MNGSLLQQGFPKAHVTIAPTMVKPSELMSACDIRIMGHPRRVDRIQIYPIPLVIIPPLLTSIPRKRPEKVLGVKTATRTTKTAIKRP